MNSVTLKPGTLERHRPTAGPELLEEVAVLGDALKGARVLHVNATAYGGGVAEILRSIIPLYRDIGIEADWAILEPDDGFFAFTKKLHNALQGAPQGFVTGDWDLFLDHNRRNAVSIQERYDLIFVHDPQPVGLREMAPQMAERWVWRCHIDTSTPDPEAWGFVGTRAQGYDATIFSVADFIGPGIDRRRSKIIQPAIDPLVPKNAPMDTEAMAKVVSFHGLDISRPFISQISRFDPWKDPLGVIDCFRLLKEAHPTLQLAMLGNFADDDPEGKVLYQEVLAAVEDLIDVHIITGLTDLVNPFQALSDVVLQKSTREGFGLTVTEALWKGTPVVAGNVGGIRLQVLDGVGGFLVEGSEECAERTDYLLNHETERIKLGETGREHVRKNFLIPRLLRDELRLINELLGG